MLIDSIQYYTTDSYSTTLAYHIMHSKINPTMKWLRSTLFLSIAILIQLGQAATATSTHSINDPIHESYHANYDDDNMKVVRMDLHPTSSYIRWLQQQLEVLDSQIENEADHSQGEGGNDKNKKGGSLRHLEEDWQIHSNIDEPLSEQKQTNEELHKERQLIQQQLDDSINSLQGTSAAYASVMELSSISNIHRDDHHGDSRGIRRHLKQSSEKLNNHNEAIAKYNEHHRQFSRYEWALREGREESIVDGAADRKMQIESSLIGTSWKAVELGFNDDSNAMQLSPILPDNSITLSFESGRISGSSGCNRYHGSATLSAENSFNTSFVGGTRMACRAEGVMEQEKNYIKFLSGRNFFYEFVNVTENGESDNNDELVLLDSIIRSKGHSVPGDIVARFIPLSESTENGSGERSTIATTEVTTEMTIIAGSSWVATEYYDGNSMTQALQGRSVTLTFDEGLLSGNTGCNDYFARVENMANSSFRIDPLAVTEMACIDEDLNSQENSYLQNFRGGTIEYNILDDGSLELQNEKSTIIAHFVPHPENADGSVPGDSHEVARSTFLQSTESTTEGFAMEELASKSLHVPDENRKLQTIQKKGGMFNAYQTSPLHQGYGTHYATIWVGTPSQRKSVIIDTGSHFTAFPCKGCDNCGEEHHTDKYFDPEASTTFRALSCGACQTAQCENDRCVFSQTYTEGSSWHAYESIDKVFVGKKELSSALNPINNSFKTDFMFGCQIKETGLFVTQLADGIMGMSAHPSTLPRAMYDQGKLEHNMFSMCFRRELHVSKQGIIAGMLTLGGIDTRVDFAPMVYAKNVATTGWFTVFVKNVYIRENGGQHAKADGPDQKLERINVDLYQMNSGKGVIIDSGTTDTYLHQSISAPFERIWQQVTGGRKYSNEPVKMDKKDLLLLPTVLVQMSAYDDMPRSQKDQIEKIPGLAGEIDPSSPQDIILAIPATHYMEYSPSKGTYTPRIYFTETRGGVIGANAMQGHNVLFDWGNKRVGFAESSCEYQEESKTVTDEGVMSVDCRLGAPSLSVSCSDSADLSRCERAANANTALNGLEIWTRIVLAPGTPQGLACEQVSAEQNEVNGGGQMEVNCDGKGVCREVRKCIISCANAIAHGTAADKSAALSPIGSCGALTWSACDYTCTQTKIDSVLMNDGKCHEEKSLEVTRPCHVQACGRSDPCRVPFVVHAIIKIRGAVASHWTKHAEDIFAESFAAKMNEKRKELLFEAGDVVVLNASPWRASDDTIFGTSSLEGEDEELGMQLVVETSIFNHNAELPPAKAGKNVPLATCHERDLQPLANIAVNIHKKLAQPKFVYMMVEKMKSHEALGEKQISPFYYTFEDMNLAKESQVVTSWTIKTDIGAGSSRIDFNAFTSGDVPMDLLLLTLLGVITAYTFWRLRLWSIRKKISSPPTDQSPRERRRGKYSRVETNGNHSADDDSMVAIGEDDVYHDDRSVMSTITEHTTESYVSGVESFRSFGSLSTYLAKTSSRGKNP